jgi:D-alanyl-D-alanine carboxypeptidase
MWVNQERALPPDFEPPDLVPVTGIPVVNQGMLLRRVALEALRRLAAAAQAEGLRLFVSSAYRSYRTQVAVHNYWVQVLGPARAARVSARPGHSEHQLGTAVDLTSPRVNYQLTEAFGETPEGRWLGANAHRFGFVMSYPAGKEEITGYDYEPWHFRYVGVDVATYVHEAGLSLEEYFRRLNRP